jgi:hypothetical protein
MSFAWRWRYLAAAFQFCRSLCSGDHQEASRRRALAVDTPVHNVCRFVKPTSSHRILPNLAVSDCSATFSCIAIVRVLNRQPIVSAHLPSPFLQSLSHCLGSSPPRFFCTATASPGNSLSVLLQFLRGPTAELLACCSGAQVTITIILNFIAFERTGMFSQPCKQTSAVLIRTTCHDKG